MGEQNGARAVQVVPFKDDEEMKEALQAGVLRTVPESHHPYTDDQMQAMLHLFGDPRQFRTMGKLTPEQIRLAALVMSKGELLGSRLRQLYVKNLFLMSRSEAAWGSNQMAEVARRIPAQTGGKPRRRLFGFGRSEG